MPTQETRVLYNEVMTLEVNTRGIVSPEETAVVILPGGGVKNPPTRLTEVPWEDYTDDLWVAGTRGDPYYTREDIIGHIARDGRLPARLATQDFAFHTPAQMAWVAKQLKNNLFINHLILSTATYHLPRAVLTFIRVWNKEGEKRKLSIGIIPTSNPSKKLLTIPSDTSRTQAEEFERIELYQKKGDVATHDEFYEFISKS